MVVYLFDMEIVSMWHKHSSLALQSGRTAHLQTVETILCIHLSSLTCKDASFSLSVHWLVWGYSPSIYQYMHKHYFLHHCHMYEWTTILVDHIHLWGVGNSILHFTLVSVKRQKRIGVRFTQQYFSFIVYCLNKTVMSHY